MADIKNISENDLTHTLSKEEIEQANKEAAEAFWDRFPEYKPKDGAPKSEEELNDFSIFEKTSREADEILFRLIQEEREKEKEKERKNTSFFDSAPVAPGFKELEDAQRKVNDIYVQLYLTENSAHLGKNVTQIMNNGEIFPEAIHTDEVMDLLCQKYLEYAREQGVPEDILNLMSSQKFSLTQMMEIKFGWEDGLSGEEVSKYANPEFSSRKMVICRYHLLCEKEKDIIQVVDNNNRKDVQKKENPSPKKTEIQQKENEPINNEKSTLVKAEYWNGDKSKPIYKEWSDGYWCKREYDTNGKCTYYEDSKGTVKGKSANVKGNETNGDNKNEPSPESQTAENNKEKDVQERKESVLLCSYKYEHNDGDQIWDDHTEFFKEDSKIKRIYTEGYYGKSSESYVTEDEMLKEMKDASLKAEKEKGQRGGHSIIKELPSDLSSKVPFSESKSEPSSVESQSFKKEDTLEKKSGIDEKISSASKKTKGKSSKKEAPEKQKDTTGKDER